MTAVGDALGVTGYVRSVREANRPQLAVGVEELLICLAVGTADSAQERSVGPAVQWMPHGDDHTLCCPYYYTQMSSHLDLGEDEGRLLARLKAGGGRMTNPTLISELGWDKDRYRVARDRLEGSGYVVRGRGRGGVVRIVDQTYPLKDDAPSADAMATAAVSRLAEETLYEPLRAVLANDWAKDHSLERSHVEITARQGRRSTGGKWTRPDIVIVALSGFRFVPGRRFDVISFEVKPFDALDITAVYEALSHLRAATQAYVLTHVPESDAPEAEDVLGEVEAECQRHGIGFIVATVPGDLAYWEERVMAKRRDTDNQRLNDFIALQIGTTGQHDILRWR